MAILGPEHSSLNVCASDLSNFSKVLQRVGIKCGIKFFLSFLREYGKTFRLFRNLIEDLRFTSQQ